jgi:hypothetical protein
MVPVYYARRHVIRGVADEALASRVIRELPAVFPASQAYLALHPKHSRTFSHSLGRFRVIRRSPNLILLAVEEG